MRGALLRVRGDRMTPSRAGSRRCDKWPRLSAVYARWLHARWLLGSGFGGRECALTRCGAAVSWTVDCTDLTYRNGRNPVPSPQVMGNWCGTRQRTTPSYSQPCFTFRLTVWQRCAASHMLQVMESWRAIMRNVPANHIPYYPRPARKPVHPGSLPPGDGELARHHAQGTR